MNIEDLIETYQKYVKDILVENRVKNDEQGYEWTYKGLEYKDKLELKAFQKFFDRTDQNDKYVERFKEQETKQRKPTAWYQNEINMIYSFHKCFAMRNQTRLQYYRNDLSQKGARNYSSINNAIGKFLMYRELTEKD
jgi:hypothetical protein